MEKEELEEMMVKIGREINDIFSKYIVEMTLKGATNDEQAEVIIGVSNLFLSTAIEVYIESMGEIPTKEIISDLYDAMKSIAIKDAEEMK